MRYVNSILKKTRFTQGNSETGEEGKAVEGQRYLYYNGKHVVCSTVSLKRDALYISPVQQGNHCWLLQYTNHFRLSGLVQPKGE